MRRLIIISYIQPYIRTIPLRSLRSPQHTFSRMVSDRISTLYLVIKIYTHSKERVKALRLREQIYRHLLNAVAVLFVYIYPKKF
jgi:hypothetical protein